MNKRLASLLLLSAAIAVAIWAIIHFTTTSRNSPRQPTNDLSILTKSMNAEAWAQAVEKVKAARGEAETQVAVETPPELRHYDDRHWFLATQVAEIAKYNIHTCQDFVDLATMIERGELVTVPIVTDTYVLFGVGKTADDGPFQDDHNIDLSNTGISREFESLPALAKNFAGRSFNIDDPTDRQAMKVAMLSSLRPEALKVLEEIASAYHRQFDRPLPVSSLVRPEQYQRALNRVNRNAVLIDTPPHSTGLAFDIDYRYMSGAEQNYLMSKLASLKKQGCIEAIRERGANYHVFAFINGTRPSDELITASLDKASAPVEESHHNSLKAAKIKSRSPREKSRRAKRRVRMGRRSR